MGTWKGPITNGDGADVSIVIPCLNEEETLPSCIRKAEEGLDAAGLRGEILVVDNGSTDLSVEISESLGATVVSESTRGYGAALRRGFADSRAAYIVMADADDSYDFRGVGAFVEKLSEGWDLVMGSRLKGTIAPGAMPWTHRHLGTPVLTWFINRLYGARISDANCGMRGFTRDAVRRMDLRTTGMELASEMVIRSAKANLKVTEVPIDFYRDGRGRPPHLRSFRDGWRHMAFILSMAPDNIFIKPGLAIAALAFLASVVLLVFGRIELGGLSISHNTMIAGIMMVIVGVHLAYVGIYSKLFTFSRGYVEETAGIRLLLRFSRLEVGLVVGLLLLLATSLGFAVVIVAWTASGLGELGLVYQRVSLFSAMLLIVGVQIMAASFFLNMVGLARATYVGDIGREIRSERRP
jgi:glycosyltransferase involved in cell wall biosynthesis